MHAKFHENVIIIVRVMAPWNLAIFVILYLSISSFVHFIYKLCTSCVSFFKSCINITFIFLTAFAFNPGTGKGGHYPPLWILLHVIKYWYSVAQNYFTDWFIHLLCIIYWKPRLKILKNKGVAPSRKGYPIEENAISLDQYLLNFHKKMWIKHLKQHLFYKNWS